MQLMKMPKLELNATQRVANLVKKVSQFKNRVLFLLLVKKIVCIFEHLRLATKTTRGS